MRTPRNLVVCSDGTGNTFDRRASNVTALTGHLVLDSTRQVVIYDQGIGTTAERAGTVSRRISGADPAAFRLLDAPDAAGVGGWLAKVRGQATGYGLKENVGQLYRAVAEEYRPGDRLFLFGFSRGAFTVRALAGLLHRCRLPDPEDGDLARRFDEAWELFQPIRLEGEVAAQVAALGQRNRPCPVHFLGVWDTVKSYGGIKAVILPHLRHNPDVRTVRHALALDERRAWFKPTTWGRLDSDRDSAMTRLSEKDRAAVEDQDILEVWFSGCHSDIGGGGPKHAVTASVALRWMLGEASAAGNGLVLNESGAALLQEEDVVPAQVHQSWNLRWRALEQVPREEIDNSGLWPVRTRHQGSDGVRDPFRSRRDEVVHLHTSVGARHSVPGPVRHCPTRRPPAGPPSPT